MKSISQVQSFLVNQLKVTLKGPVKEAQYYEEREGVTYRILEWEVENGTRIETDLPLGWIVNILPISQNSAKLELKIPRKVLQADGTYTDGFPTAKEKIVGATLNVLEKFRKFFTIETTITRLKLPTNQVDSLPDPGNLGTNETKITHRKIDDNKYEREVEKTILNQNVSDLVGQIAYVEGTLGYTQERMVAEGTAADKGFLVSESEVVPDGFGNSVKKTISVPSWPELLGCEWDHELNASILQKQQFVPPGTGLGNQFTSLKPINEDRSLRIVEVPPLAALDSYHLTVPGTHPADDLPELVAVDVAWNVDAGVGNGDSGGSGYSQGSYASLSLDSNSKGSAAISIDPAVSVVMKHKIGRMLSATHHFFYLPVNSSGAAVLAKAGASNGVFPGREGTSRTISAIGMKASCSVTAAVGQSVNLSDSNVSQVITKGNSSDRSFATTTQFIQIPPSTGSAAVNVTYNKQLSVRAQASMAPGINWTALSNIAQDTISAQGSVNLSGAGAVGVTGGSYAVSVSCEPYKWGYMRCHVKVVDFD